ncbi:hypothetical protein N7495_007024 [Penicillium taxi]|uniref:uncharacterized protein n=1 Tax=Penicillium taxi TaxID=168475 RepID=UPI0025457B53|nr:uncharacterized protein N7495_007024 [Penicillium taxi]KAJ5895333.1 hypothetical protein N7495_007024 [Penicillium taxi]
MNAVGLVRYFRGGTENLFGQFFQNGSITDGNFIDMIDFIIDSEPRAPISIFSNETGTQLLAGPQILAIGDYDIYPTPGSTIQLTNDECIRRVPSRITTRAATPRELAFRNGVRNRDGMCVISGVLNRSLSIPGMKTSWRGWQSAHLFPLARVSLWDDLHLDRFITDQTFGGHRAGINSIQNGLCLRNDIHDQFDDFEISINPEDGYKIVDFGANNNNLDGRILDPVCRNPQDPNRVSDDLLRWHWQQTLLRRMKGSASPVWEYDFPEGSDMIGEILRGPLPGERMEAELFARLHHMIIDD